MQPLTRSLVTIVCAFSLMSGSFLFLGVKSALADDYTFGSESVNTGYSVNPSNRNAEDAAYNELIEADQYTDTNYSGSSENVVYGQESGSFPSDLNTDDGTRYSYTEENTGGAPPASYLVYLFPNGDSSVNWDLVFPADGVHYTKVDEPNHDGSTTYIRTSTATDIDIFTMGDMGDPGAGYTLDVNVFAVHQKDGTQPCNFQAGIRISSTNYLPISVNPSNGAWNNDTGAVWELNPSTSGEWTFAEVNGLLGVITTDDASPNVYCTQIGLRIQVNFSAADNYELDAQITYGSIVSSAQTTGYTVLCQGYRTDASEDFYVQVWNYTSTDWVTKDTIDQGSDTDFNFNLLGWAANCERSSGDEVKIRILGATESSDTTQNVVYLDVLKVMRIEQGYDLDVELTSTTAPEHGNITLRIKGYTSAETIQIDVYNYTSVDWDVNKLQITDLGNAWQETIDLCDDHHRSTQTVKVRVVDTVAASADTTQDTFYLDVIWVTRYFTDPEISDYTTTNIEITEGEDAIVWCTYSDYDDQAPTYVRVHTNATYYAMDANDSDTTYHDGKLYGKTLSGLAVGWYYYWFAVDDAESDEVTTEVDTYTITVNPSDNNEPYFTSTPTATGHNNTLYYYDANAVDDDGYPPDLVYDLEGNITDWASITPSTGVVQGTPTEIGDYWMNVSVTDTIMEGYVWQNTSIHIYTDSPSFTSEPITTWLNGTEYQYTATATDPETEALVFHLEGNGTSWASIDPSGYSCPITGDLTEIGWWYLNLSVTDGKHTVWQNFSVNSTNDAPYFTSEPVLTGIVNESYEYLAVAQDNNSDTLIYSISESPSETLAWLECNATTGRVNGTPTINGTYMVNLSVMDSEGALTWQNFSIVVDLSDADTANVMLLLLAMAFCFIFTALGLREKLFWFIAAGAWMFSGAAIFIQYADAFMVLGIGTGLMLLFVGAYDVWKN